MVVTVDTFCIYCGGLLTGLLFSRRMPPRVFLLPTARGGVGSRPPKLLCANQSCVTLNFQKKEVRLRHWTGYPRLAQGRAPSWSKAPSVLRFLSSGTSVLCFFVILSLR